MNRFKLLLIAFVVILVITLITNNVYISYILLTFGFIMLICGFAVVIDNMNDKEKIFYKKLERFFNI